jgi:zinc/manganese transport system permease protein
MTDALFFLGPALVMCFVLAGIHVYLGMHVLQREVIFIDLSLAQIAALGATVGAVTAEIEPGTLAASLFAFAFTAVGAVLFAFTRRVRKRVPQEAIIGIVYAVASAATVLMMSRGTHETEHIKDMLVGQLLGVTWPRVGFTAIEYAVIGVVHALLAPRAIRISWMPDRAENEMRVEWWDLAFYLLFGAVITTSVQVAGVLLVFTLLIVPAVITRLFSERFLPRLLAGWGLGLLGSVLGIAASWTWDLPTGAAVVVAFGGLLVLAAVGRGVLSLRARAA